MATTSTTDFPAVGQIAKPAPVPTVLNPAPKAALAACLYNATRRLPRRLDHQCMRP